MDRERFDSLHKVSVLILDRVYEKTSYPDSYKEEAEAVFGAIKSYLPLIASKDKQGIEVVNKFSSFANSVSDQDGFKDMIKIIWRTIKVKAGQPQYKLSLFLIAIAVIVQNISPTYNNCIDEWVTFIIQWLGNQLTIGGKGVVGEGEGSVVERISRFFCTPYLHDFD